MDWTVELTRDAVLDLALLFDHLEDSYLAFGDTPEKALKRAGNRIASIREAIRNLANTPYSGTKHPNLGPEIRHVTKDRGIIWFSLQSDGKVIRILGIFFGGQNHLRSMYARILSEPDD